MCIRDRVGFPVHPVVPATVGPSHIVEGPQAQPYIWSPPAEWGGVSVTPTTLHGLDLDANDYLGNEFHRATRAMQGYGFAPARADAVAATATAQHMVDARAQHGLDGVPLTRPGEVQRFNYQHRQANIAAPQTKQLYYTRPAGFDMQKHCLIYTSPSPRDS